jgi:hypothetical protein
MAKIAAQMVIADDGGTNRELVFAVCHVSEMLSAFRASYYAAWQVRSRGMRSEAPGADRTGSGTGSASALTQDG